MEMWLRLRVGLNIAMLFNKFVLQLININFKKYGYK